MSSENFRETLAIGNEVPGIEFKGPFARTDKGQFAEVVRAVLGMANRRDGGQVIIGVDEARRDDGPGTVLNAVGLSAAEFKGWDQDAVLSILDSYADPFVELDIEPVEHDGKHFIVLRVREFDEFPVLCKKQYVKQKGRKDDVVLRQGGCYVRRRGKVETSEIPTHVEMRELLDLATEKGVRRFVQRAQRVGMQASSSSIPLDDAARFDEQRGEFR